MILLLFKFINVFKAKITPDKVRFYSPVEKKYFEGDFSMLEKLLGTKINFQQLQNLESFLYTHFEDICEILKKYDFLDDKKIIVISTYYPGINFKDFPNDNSLQFPNLRYLDIKYEDEDFFPLDMHLNKDGHQKIANTLSNYLK